MKSFPGKSSTRVCTGPISGGSGKERSRGRRVRPAPPREDAPAVGFASPDAQAVDGRALALGPIRELGGRIDLEGRQQYIIF